MGPSFFHIFFFHWSGLFISFNICIRLLADLHFITIYVNANKHWQSGTIAWSGQLSWSRHQCPDQEILIGHQFKISKSRNFCTTKPPAVKRAQKIDAIYWFSENSVDGIDLNLWLTLKPSLHLMKTWIIIV